MKKTASIDTPETLQTEEVRPENKTKKSSYFEIRIPKFSFKNTQINAYLVFVAIVFSFLLGMLTNKVIYLEQNAKTNQTNNKIVQGAQAAAAVPSAGPTAPPQRITVDAGKLPLLGDPNAKVTVVEFSDFQCPYCKKYFDDTSGQLYDEYIKTGKVKFAYRHLPLSFHANSQKASEASECANEQSKFWDYHDLLFKNQEAWSAVEAAKVSDTFTDYASQLGLNTDQFRNCLDTDKYKQNVDDDNQAGAKVGINGTPSFSVNGLLVVGAVPFSELKKDIDQALNQ